MSVAYRAVQWNKHKRVYDLILVGAVTLYIVVFVAVGAALRPEQTELNATGTYITLLILVYVAYGLLVMHVTLGFLQEHVSVVYAVMLGVSAVTIEKGIGFRISG